VLFYVLFLSVVLFYVLFLSMVLFCVLFLCKCVLYYCHRVATQLQLNISYHVSFNHIIMLYGFISLLLLTAASQIMLFIVDNSSMLLKPSALYPLYFRSPAMNCV